MLVWLVGLSGCATYAQQGALVGGLAGAAIGASHSNHHRGGNTSRDAIVGAALGVALGVGVGSVMDDSSRQYPQPQMRRPIPMGYPQPQRRSGGSGYGSPTYEAEYARERERIEYEKLRAYEQAERARAKLDARTRYGY